jgi:HEAT repeat protein
MLSSINFPSRLPKLIVRSGAVLLLAAGIAGLLASPGGRGGRVSAQDLNKLNRFLQASNASDAAMKVFRQGRDLIEEENWTRAAERFNDFITDYPKHKDVDAALYWLAFALKKQEKFQEADQKLERLIKEFPRSSWRDDAEAMRVEIANRVGNPGAIAQGLDKNNEELKLVALQSLFQANAERATAFVAEILKPGSTASRRLKETAVALLGQPGGSQATAMLIDIARNQTDAKLRRSAIFWLGQRNDESAFNLLKEMAARADEGDAKTALHALSQHNSARAREFLSELARSAPSLQIRKDAIFWLGQRGGEAVVDELMKIYDADSNLEIKKQVLFALSQHSGARAKLLEVARSGADLELRSQAIHWLGQSGGAAVEELIQIYDADTNERIRKQVIFALSQSNNARAQAKLQEIARASDSLEMRRQAIHRIGQQGGAQAVDSLIQLYDAEKNERVKEQILFALSQTGKKAALQKLMQVARSDASLELRKKALFWLGQSNDPEAAKFLEEILKLR